MEKEEPMQPSDYRSEFIRAAEQSCVDVDTREGRAIASIAERSGVDPSTAWAVFRDLMLQARFVGRSESYLRAAYRGELASLRSNASAAASRKPPGSQGGTQALAMAHRAGKR